MTNKPIVDDGNYTVTGINGFRRGSLKRDEAIAMARRMQEQMDRMGWRGKMRVYYRDGSPVDWATERSSD